MSKQHRMVAKTIHTTILSGPVAAVFLATSGFAQLNLPHTFAGSSSNDLFGDIVERIGDVNGDGVLDLLVAAPWEDVPGIQRVGSVRIYSGLDGALLRTHVGSAAGDSFGDGAGGAGDVDADGVADYIIGASGDDTGGFNAGAAYVYSGATGSVLLTFFGPVPSASFGIAVAGAGDVDADGHDDLIVGSAVEAPGGTVRVFSGFDGSLLYSYVGASHDRVGDEVSAAGDIDHDGFDDFMFAAPAINRVELRSGADGSLLHLFVSGSGSSTWGFGRSIDILADVDGDGADEIIIGEPLGTGPGPSFGIVWIYSGATGLLLRRIDGPSTSIWFGASVSHAGDIDGDGTEDILVGATRDSTGGHSAGLITIVSGRTGTLIYSVAGTAGARFGRAVASAGDVDGDGTPDFLVGAPGDSPGSATLISGRRLTAIGTRHCAPAVPNSAGHPAVMHAFGSLAAVANDATLVVAQLPSGASGYFIASRSQGFVNPPGSMGFLCLGGAIARYIAPGQIVQGPVGRLVLDLTSVPVSPPQAVAPGETWRFQCWYREGASSNFSDVVEIVFE